MDSSGTEGTGKQLGDLKSRSSSLTNCFESVSNRSKNCSKHTFESQKNTFENLSGGCLQHPVNVYYKRFFSFCSIVKEISRKDENSSHSIGRYFVSLLMDRTLYKQSTN